MSVKTSAAEKLATGKIAIDAEFWFHGEGVLDFVTFRSTSLLIETTGATRIRTVING